MITQMTTRAKLLRAIDKHLYDIPYFGIAIVLLSIINWGLYHHSYQTLLGLSLGLIILSFVARTLYGTVGQLVWSFFAVVSLWQGFGIDKEFSQYGVQTANAFRAAGLGSFVFFILVSFMPIVFTKKDYKRYLFFLFGALSVFDACWVIASRLLGLSTWGVLNNYAMDSMLIIFGVPFLLRGKRRIPWSVFLCLVGILVGGSTTGIISIAVCLGSYYAAKNIHIAKSICYCLIILGICIWFGDMFVPDFFSGNGRFEIWKLTYEFWLEKDFLWTGLGAGSFSVYAPHVQIIKNYHPYGFYVWAHNEYYQMLFEFGYIGLAVFLFSVSHILVRTFRRPYLFSFFCTYAFVSVTQMPLRLFLTAMILAFILSFALASDKIQKA